MKRLWVPVAVSLLAAATAPKSFDRAQGTGPADAVRFQILVHSWGLGMRASDLRKDTLIVTARPGQTIGAMELADYSHAFRGKAPLVFERAEGPDRVRVRFIPQELVPRLPLCFDPRSRRQTPVLVSTTARTFSTPTICGGTTVELQIARVLPGPEVRSRHALEVLSRHRHEIGKDQLDRDLMEAGVVGVFRLVGIETTGDSVGPPSRRRPLIDLEFVAEEVWNGAQLDIGRKILVAQPDGTTREGGWLAQPTRRSMRVGDSHVLFLRRFERGQHAGRWTFSAFDGYALFDSTRRLVSSLWQRRIPRRQYQRDIVNRAWSLSHLERARTHGRAIHAGSGLPGRELRVSVGRAAPTAVTDSTGYFELFDVPIGFQELRVEGPGVEATALVEFSDEFTDSLEIRVPF